MLWAGLNKSWKQHPKKTAAVRPLTSNHANHSRKTRYAGVSKDELISEILLWTPTHGHTSIDRPAKTYIHRLCADTGCRVKDLPGAMDDLDEW